MIGYQKLRFTVWHGYPICGYGLVQTQKNLISVSSNNCHCAVIVWLMVNCPLLQSNLTHSLVRYSCVHSCVFLKQSLIFFLFRETQASEFLRSLIWKSLTVSITLAVSPLPLLQYLITMRYEIRKKRLEDNTACGNLYALEEDLVAWPFARTDKAVSFVCFRACLHTEKLADVLDFFKF